MREQMEGEDRPQGELSSGIGGPTEKEHRILMYTPLFPMYILYEF